MASTKTDICNMALQFIGFGSEAIVSDVDTETSEEATICKFWFERRRDLLIRQWPWLVGQTYAELTLVQENPNDDWEYSYRYPPDCLFAERMLRGGQGTRVPEFHPPVAYTIAQDDQGWLIFTDQSPACLKYIRRLDNTAYYDEQFNTALAWSMATVIALPLGRAVAFQTNAKQEYTEALADAASVSANEPTDDEEAPSTAIRNRQGYPNVNYYRPVED